MRLTTHLRKKGYFIDKALFQTTDGKDMGTGEQVSEVAGY